MTTDVEEASALRVARSARLLPPRLGWEPTLLVALFVAFAGLAVVFPLNGDDWAWGGTIGTDRLRTWFEGYNGRYAGNLAVLALTRGGWLTPLVVALVMCAVVWLVQDVTRNRTPSGYLLTTLLLLVMPLTMWRESVSWLSGFANYVMPTVLVLVMLRSAQRDWLDPAQPAPWRVLPAAVLGFGAALFVEHVTMYLVAAVAVHVAAQAWRRRRVTWTSVGWLVGVVAGAALMFSNEAYRTALEATDSTRQVNAEGGFLGNMLDQLAGLVSKLSVVDFSALNWTLALLVCALALPQAAERAPRGRARLVAVGVVAVLLAGGSALRTTYFFPSLQVRSERWSGWIAVLMLVLLVVLARVVTERLASAQLLVVAASLLGLALPMSVVTPLGPRCFFPSYVLLVGVVSVLLRDVLARWGGRPEAVLMPFLGALVLAALAGYTVVYLTIRDAAIERLQVVRAAAAAGATEVKVYRLPFGSWVHVPDPVGIPWEERYKAYYRIPQSVRIHVVPRPLPVPTPTPQR